MPTPHAPLDRLVKIPRFLLAVLLTPLPVVSDWLSIRCPASNREQYQ